MHLQGTKKDWEKKQRNLSKRFYKVTENLVPRSLYDVVDVGDFVNGTIGTSLFVSALVYIPYYYFSHFQV